MRPHELDALPLAELKGRRDELAEAIKCDAKALAVLYLKRLYDARNRDEKLAEQGKTITLLQEAAEQAKARIVDLEAASAADKNALYVTGETATKQLQSLQADAAAAQAKHALDVVEVQDERDAASSRAIVSEAKATRLKAVVDTMTTALGASAKALADAQAVVTSAAGTIAVDQAEHGK